MSESKLRELSMEFSVDIIELLHRTKYIDEQSYKTLSAKCASLRAMLIASCRTAKENAK